MEHESVFPQTGKLSRMFHHLPVKACWNELHTIAIKTNRYGRWMDVVLDLQLCIKGVMCRCSNEYNACCRCKNAVRYGYWDWRSCDLSACIFSYESLMLVEIVGSEVNMKQTAQRLVSCLLPSKPAPLVTAITALYNNELKSANTGAVSYSIMRQSQPWHRCSISQSK